LFFSACSTKEVYEPLTLGKPWTTYEVTTSKIIDTTPSVALLEDRTVLTKNGVINLDINASNRVIAYTEGWVISGSIDGNLTLISENDANITKNIDLKKTVASATVQGNELAVLFADNEIAIYDLESKSALFKEQGSKFIAADARIVSPLFLNGLVFFSTLDGKVIIVNDELKKRLRTMIVSSEDNFNNIIAMRFVENRLIAATSYELLAMAKKEIRAKYEIRNVIFDKNTIYVATKQGEILSLTSNLEVNSKIKLPFAHFYGMVAKNGKLYILEKEGYMIVLDQESFEYTVHQFTLQSLRRGENSKIYNDFMDSNHFTPSEISLSLDEAYIFVTDKEFYINDKKIIIE
ncbi:MAG: hypothetical protein U9N39_01150, partial [Campylobacterota bacterium]|nr:hypothetical protein [Campylobacterota bacterium]